jgi:hypothetical protein
VKPIVLHPAAETEMRAAADYYEICHPGLGDRFLDEVALAGGRIAEHPEACPVISGHIRSNKALPAESIPVWSAFPHRNQKDLRACRHAPAA